MRYFVTARLKDGCRDKLERAIEDGSLGAGSIAGSAYFEAMDEARCFDDGTVRWVEVCYCPTPLQEERPYWEEFFRLERIADAHYRTKCRDENGSEPWACGDCDCTERLEAWLQRQGEPFRGAPAVEDPDD
ncbi:MAG: hypothetical protein PVJ51_02270 [Acidobacteriota bacterium]